MAQIGGYQILEELGRGAMGAVYRGRAQGTDAQVAIKTLLAGRDATPLQRSRFEREAKVLAKVESPHVVRLLEAGVHEGTPFLVMDFQPGGSLEAVVRRSSLPVADVVLLGEQLASGLEAAHALGVLHRDLKPANVLLGSGGEAMLTDFGLAKDLQREGQTQRLTQSGIFLGSPGYWAPEQAAANQALIGPATDVYGLGAILYEALVGRPPIVSTGLVQNLHMTANERPPALRSLRADVPASLEAVVMRCLEKEVDARWASAREVREALASCGEEGEPRDTPRGLLGAAALGLVGLAGVAALAAWVVGRGPEARPEARPEVSLASSGDDLPSPISPEAGYRRARALLDQERYAEAAPLLLQAAEAGHVEAAFELGGLLAQGQGVAQDVEEGATWYRRAVEGEHFGAACELGLLLARRGLSKDEAEARELLRRASEGAHAPSMSYYGEFLWRGRGGPRALSVAADWFRKGSDLGDRRAMFLLGLALEAGRGVPKDVKGSASWFLRAAELGMPEAMYKFGWCLETGAGVATDQPASIEWYRRGAEAGHKQCMAAYATLFEFGQGVPVDFAVAVKWYRRAAKAGGEHGRFGLGRCFEKGRGVPQSYVRAAELYRQAADHGLPQAMVGLGILYSKGAGVTKNKPEAAALFRRAAEQGNPHACYSLGEMLRTGDGIKQDEAEAFVWLERAAKQNHPEGLYSLGAILSVRGDPEGVVRAAECFRRASRQGVLSATYNLAVAYARGAGVTVDLVESKRLFQIVASRAKRQEVREAAEGALRALNR